MASFADVLRFPASERSMRSIGIVLFAPAFGSKSAALRDLHQISIGDTETQSGAEAQLDHLFEQEGAIRFVAMDTRAAQPPIGFALAVPVATTMELAAALAVNRVDPHVRDTLTNRRSWALLVGVLETVRRFGIGRKLANLALDDIRDAGGQRVYLAARARDGWMAPWLLNTGFTRDATTVERIPRVLYSRETTFSF